jgi:threonyl-tRNA synthetase
LLVVGDKEMEAGEVAVRSRKGDDRGKLSIDAFIEMMGQQVTSKQLD